MLWNKVRSSSSLCCRSFILASPVSTPPPICVAQSHLQRPALLPGHVVGPALAAAGELLAMGNQPLVQLAGEHRDAVHPGVVSEWQVMQTVRLRVLSRVSSSR